MLATLHHRFGDVGDQRRRYVDSVHLLQMPLDLRVVIFREYIEMILSSKPVNRVCPFDTIFGSKLRRSVSRVAAVVPRRIVLLIIRRDRPAPETPSSVASEARSRGLK